MWKKIIVSCLVASSSITLFAQSKPFTINGTISGKPAGIIYLSYQDDKTGKMVTDSAAIDKGKFMYSGAADGAKIVYITLVKTPRSISEYFQALVSPGKLTLSLDEQKLSDGTIDGSSVQSEANELNKSRSEVYSKLSKINEAYSRKNAEYMQLAKNNQDEVTLKSLKDTVAFLKEQSGKLAGQAKKVEAKFMDKYPSGFATANILKGLLRQMPYTEALQRYTLLHSEVKNSPMGKSLKLDLDKLASGSTGAIAYAFASKELDGDSLALKQYRGKYVLLDFWASWCIPCRQGNPHLINLYAKYKPKGLEIVGIADNDSSEGAWRKAVQDDKIGIWKHILRGYDGKSTHLDKVDISKKYGVVALPTKILVDPSGKIIARFLGGGQSDPELDKKLKEIFGS